MDNSNGDQSIVDGLATELQYELADHQYGQALRLLDELNARVAILEGDQRFPPGTISQLVSQMETDYAAGRLDEFRRAKAAIDKLLGSTLTDHIVHFVLQRAT